MLLLLAGTEAGVLCEHEQELQDKKDYVNTDVYICNMIVSDASTLILLARVSILRIFLSAFGKIIVPEEVAKEMTVSPNFDARMLEREIKENNIVVKRIKSSTDEITGQFRLDKGRSRSVRPLQ